MKALFIVFSLFLFSSINAQEERQLQSFESLDVAGGIYVTLIKSNENKAVIKMISGDENSVLVTDVINGELDIQFEKKKKYNWNTGNRKAEIDLYYRSLDGIEVSAGAKVYGDETLDAKNLELDASSGGSIKLYIDVADLEVDVSSGASISLDGNAINSEVDVSSGASYRGSGLQTESTKVSASSGASAKVWANKRINADASSGGSVKYKGEPKDVDIDAGKYSGGSVRKI